VKEATCSGRVLVVDDEIYVRMALRYSLVMRGYEADDAASGPQALEMLSQRRYDLMVVDIRMPGMDGVEVMRRAREACPDLQIIVLTGYASLDSAIAAVRCHAADYLIKPASLHQVADAVARALRQRPGARALAPIAPEREAEEEVTVLQVGPVILDRSLRTVTVEREGSRELRARLSPTETAILFSLMRRAGEVVDCQTLVREALGYEASLAEARELIRPHICRLRRKVERDSRSPRWIHTMTGQGYLFATPDTEN
jgi:DNA-binding response OmpR family regulator